MDPISLTLGGLAGAGVTTLLARTREHRREPAGLADLLNWAFLVDDGVVLLKDGAFLSGFRYRGPDLSSATSAELDALSAQLNDALLPYTDGWMFHLDALRASAPPYPAGRFPTPVTAWIDAERRAAVCSRCSSRPQFVSEYVMTLTHRPPRDVYTRAAHVFLQGRPRGVDWRHVLGAYRGAVDGFEQRLASRLRLERLDADAIVSHLHRCLTGLEARLTAPPVGAYLDSVLASQEMIGGFAPRVGRLHLRLVAITGYPASSSLGRLDFLNTLPFTYRWSSRFIPVGVHAAASLIQSHQQRWFMGRKGVGSFLRDVTGGDDPAAAATRTRQNEELFNDQDATRMAQDAARAAADNASGAMRFGFSTQVVVVPDEDPVRADARAAHVVAALRDHGFAARIETVNAVDAFFGTLPGHGYANLRRPLLATRNVADLWPVTGVWSGLPAVPSPYFPPASPPLVHLATDGSTPFRLNLHVGDVGHTLVVGATGSGKSTFVGLLIAQWQRYPRAQLFIFDVGYSHWLLAAAAGAQHYDVDLDGRAHGSTSVAFQPLADVDEPRERVWAAGWLETLAELQGVTVTPPQRLRLDRALTLLAAEPRAHRTLTELTVQLQDPELLAAFAPYTVGGPFGRLLDASRDTIDAGGGRGVTKGAHHYQVFELRALLDLDDRVLVPVLLHLFRRVERRLDGSPTLIVIEELWAPLLRTVFARRIQQWLLSLRKQNAAVVLVAHSPAQLDGVPAREVIIESCPTKVLLPNPEAATPAGATRYRDLGLNDRELGLLAAAVPKRDYYVKAPLGSRLVRLDLGPVALAFLGTPGGRSPDEIRPEVGTLAAREGPAWPAAWVRSHGVTPPEVERSADGLYLARDTGSEPAANSIFHVEDLPHADLVSPNRRTRDMSVS